MAYSAKDWAKVKTAYESGKFHSVEEIQKKYKKISIDAIRRRTVNWDKSKLKPLVEKSIQEKYVEAFAKIGFDEHRVAKIINELGNGSEKAQNDAVTQHSKITGAYATEKIKVELPDVPSTLQVVVIDSGKRKK